MTARKPKPRKAAVRKGCKPTLEQRVGLLEETVDLFVVRRLDALGKHLDALETRGHFRDASHDEPVSNDFEAVNCSPHLLRTPREIDVWFAGFKAADTKRWWQFWRRL